MKVLTNKHIKIISWLAILGAGVTPFLIAWAMFETGIVFNIGILISLAVITAGVYGGWLTLKNERLGKKLLVAFYAPQVISYFSQSFYFSFNSSISFSITGSTNNGSVISFNLFAFIMLLLCIRMLREHNRLTNHSSKDAVTGAS